MTPICACDQIDAVTDEHVTSVQLRDRSICVARALIANGIKAGDCLSICSTNRLEFMYVLFGTAFIGATLAPLNVQYTEGMPHTQRYSHSKQY